MGNYDGWIELTPGNEPLLGTKELCDQLERDGTLYFAYGILTVAGKRFLSIRAKPVEFEMNWPHPDLPETLWDVDGVRHILKLAGEKKLLKNLRKLWAEQEDAKGPICDFLRAHTVYWDKAETPC